MKAALHIALLAAATAAGCTSFQEELFVTELACATHEDCPAAARCNAVLGTCVTMPAAKVGQPCARTACEAALWCAPADRDPSGVATCRTPCAAGACAGAELRCADLGGTRACVPKQTADQTCAEAADCAAGLICLTGAPGDAQLRACRPACDPEAGVPDCAAGRICADPGGCAPDPCASASCASGSACRRLSATEASCTVAGRGSGTFAVRISTLASPVFGSASGTVEAPGVPSFALTGGSFAAVSTIEGREYLLVAVYGPREASGNHMLLHFVRTRGLAAGRPTPINWSASAQLEHQPAGGGTSTVRAIGISGTITLDVASTALGADLRGSFDLALAPE